MHRCMHASMCRSSHHPRYSGAAMTSQRAPRTSAKLHEKQQDETKQSKTKTAPVATTAPVAPVPTTAAPVASAASSATSAAAAVTGWAVSSTTTGGRSFITSTSDE
eukprot:GHVU01233733.1.p1 GENE.GHVU01233733.1~~GHVU01233733.1.p1  ORF type:complete len:106 (+),score=12.77 GHVU01233733.1:137-454(+)